MGLYQRAAKALPEQFSIFQMMATLGMTEDDHHEARNILKQWYQLGLVKRISDNMYQRVSQARAEEQTPKVAKKASKAAAPKKKEKDSKKSERGKGQKKVKDSKKSKAKPSKKK